METAGINGWPGRLFVNLELMKAGYVDARLDHYLAMMEEVNDDE